jgi:hypothetical protein
MSKNSYASARVEMSFVKYHDVISIVQKRQSLFTDPIHCNAARRAVRSMHHASAAYWLGRRTFPCSASDQTCATFSLLG